MRLATKTIVVTGAGKGIGRELSLQLLRRRANVAGVDINRGATHLIQKKMKAHRTP